MKTTYTGTIFHQNLAEATVRLFVYEGCKYTGNAGEEIEVKYTGVTAWDLIEGGEEAEAIEAMTDANSVDEFHEYLVLHFEDGTESTFRNSHVDMFIR